MTYQLGVIPRFPARVVAGVGIRIDRANATYTFSTDYGTVAPGSVADPANTDVLVQLPDGTYATVPVSAIAASTLPVEQTGKKNALINGGMEVWQRGTSFVPVAATRTYCADRWAVKTAAGTLTSVSRGTAPTTGRTPFLMTITGNAAVTTVDIDQRIEASNAVPLIGPMTYSALITNGAVSTFAPTLFVECPTVTDNWAASNVRNNAGAGDVLQSCPPGVTTRVTWSADTSGYGDVAKGIAFRLRIPSGSLDVNTKTVSITEVQAEPRPAVDGLWTLFEVENFGDEVDRCQRYFCKSFPYGTVPAQNAGSPGGKGFIQVAAAATAQGSNNHRWPTTMRGVPTLVTYNPLAVNAQIRNTSASSDWTAVTIFNACDQSADFSGTTAAGSVAGQGASIHFTADAEL
jgi:hypothetical protein